MIILPIRPKYFYQIRTGQKKDDCRDCKAYYISKFKRVYKINISESGEMTNDKGEKIILTAPKWLGLKSGYATNDPVIYVFATLRTETVNEVTKFVLDIQKVTDIKPNWRADE